MTDHDGSTLEDLTHDELDELAEARGIPDYPSSGVKADKLDAIRAADEEPAVVLPSGVGRFVRPGSTSPTLQAAAEGARAEAARVTEQLEADRAARGEVRPSAAYREQAAATRALEEAGARQLDEQLAALGDQQAAREA